MKIKWTSELEIKLKKYVESGLEDKQIALKMNSSINAIHNKRKRLGLFKNKKTKNSNLSTEQRVKKIELQNIKYKKKYRKKNIIKIRLKDAAQTRASRALAANEFNKGNRMLYWKKRIISLKSTKRYKVSINEEDLENQWVQQNGKCLYTKIDLKAEIPGGRKQTDSLISIDRINPDLGYEKNNISLVSFDINTMKRDYTHKQFIELCRLIGKNE